jgi:CubicO group peptidase (beta-lactamase class C family)
MSVLMISGCNCNNVLANSTCPEAGDHAVTEALKVVRQKYRVPAIAGAIATSTGIDVCGVVGVRKSRTDVAATLDDKWHFGSDTKAMTATLVGRLVDEGMLQWNTTMTDVFPNMASGFSQAMKDLAVLHLLSHHAGLPANLSLRSTLWFMAVAEEAVPRRSVRKH